MKILIVEDEPDVAEMMKMFLEDAGYNVDIAISGKKGIEKIKEKIVDIVLLDLRMPDISGRQILKMMKKENIKIPVIVVTAVACMDVVKTELQTKYNIDGFVSKPHLHEFLVDEIKRVASKYQKV